MSEPGVDMQALVAALRAHMPAAMQALPQWLLWRYEQYEGDKKPRKVPYYVSGRKRRGGQGTVEDRAELSGIEPALTHLQRGRFDGLGFAFLPGDGLIGIDIDGAIDGDGVIAERAARIIEACASYTEYSPSGRGVHIIVAGESETFKDNKIGLEVFCGRQFFTCTGRPWAGAAADVAPIDAAVLRRLKVTVMGARDAAPAAGRAVAGASELNTHAAVYCLAALASAERAIRGAGEGGRNDALNTQAFGLAQLVHTGGVSEATVRAVLGDAAKAAGLSGPEIKATLDSACKAGLAEPRLIPAPRGGRRGAAARVGADTPSTASGGGGGEAPPDAPAVAGGGDERGRWRRRLLGEGGTKDCRENVFMQLAHNPALAGLVGYDEFAHMVVKQREPPWKSGPGEWTTNDDYLLGMWLAEHERMTIKSEATLVAGVAMAAFHCSYHPVLDYLRGRPAWDGIERLPHWLHECVGAEDSTYTRMVGTWFVMGMVKRVREPGCQLDYMIVLEGLQGKRKSSALRALAVRDEWFADTPVRIGTPDALLSIAGKWLFEFAEMDSFNRAESTAVKSYITSRTDRVREPYARRHVDRKRSGVLAGSTNQSEYFKDPTGARRFWPVACDADVDLEKLVAWRDQMFAEAMHRLDSADPEVRRCWPTRAEEEQYLVPQQEQREIVDPWFEKLAAWLDSGVNYGETGLTVREVESFTSFDLLTRCLNVPMDRIDGGRQMATRVGIGMHKLGWVKRRDSGAGRVWRYWRPGASTAPAAGGGSGMDAPGGPGDGLHEF